MVNSGFMVSYLPPKIYTLGGLELHRYILPNCGDVKTPAVLVNEYSQVYNQKFFASKSI